MQVICQILWLLPGNKNCTYSRLCNVCLSKIIITQRDTWCNQNAKLLHCRHCQGVIVCVYYPIFLLMNKTYSVPTR